MKKMVRDAGAAISRVVQVNPLDMRILRLCCHNVQIRTRIVDDRGETGHFGEDRIGRPF
jgi:hypothetical protein